MFDVTSKNVLVVGLGISGCKAAELLAKKGAKVKVTEEADASRVQEYVEPLASYDVQFELGGHTEKFCRGADIVVTSPGASFKSLPLDLARKEGVPVIGELELGARFCPASIIAITGTNGKSTTTELIGRILTRSGRHTVVCGNIGNPLTGEVETLTEESVAVVEVSSFQLETIKDFHAHVAVLLNVAEDHYERHFTYDNYKLEKFKVFNNQTGSDWAVLHSDFTGDKAIDQITGKRVFFGSGTSEASAASGDISVGFGGKREVIISEKEVPLKGRHNMDNVACSVLVSKVMGVSNECIRGSITAFKGLAHRFEEVGGFSGVKFIDDSKATNIDATRRALQSLDEKVVLIAGGRDKGADYVPIVPLVKEKVKALVVIGEASGKMKEVFSPAVRVSLAVDMKEAVKKASQEASGGGTVMLSPMCSSFDMYSSYKERGEVFQGEIKKLSS